MLADLSHQIADRAVRVVGAAAAEDEGGVFFAECIQAPVGPKWLSDPHRPRLLALDYRQELIEFGRRISHLVDVGEVYPGQELHKVERMIDRRGGQDHRNYRKCRFARLSEKRQVPFILLGISKPARSNQNNGGAASSNGVFQGANA